MNLSKIFVLLKSCLIFSLIALISPLSSYAYVGLCCGKCGGNMPMNIPGGGIPETHEFRLKISPMYMNMGRFGSGTKSLNVDDYLGMPVMGGNPTGKYMAVPTNMDMYMGNITLGYSFSDDFFGGLMLMPTKKSMDMKFSTMMQGMTGKARFTMKSEGLGDIMLMTKYRLYADDPLIPASQVSFFGGLSLPTGSINMKNKTHPLTMRQGELLPYGMQLGSGTFDPTIGVLYEGSASPYWWGLNMMYTPRLDKNSKKYSLGDEFRFDMYGMYQLSYNLLAQMQLNGSFQGKIKGEMKEATEGTSGRATQGNAASPYMTPLWDPKNSGHGKVSITAGMQWQPLPSHIIDLNVGVPLYNQVNGTQIRENFRVMLTWYIEIPTPKSRRYTGSKSKLGF